MRSKSACSLSIIETTNSTGSPRFTASRNIRSVPVSTPCVARTTHERAVGGGESGDRVALEVEIPWGVDEVDLRVLPLGERGAEVDRVAALDLFGRRCR